MRWITPLLLTVSLGVAAFAQQRFDFKVREDMFAGMDGDAAAFDRAMKLIADTLAADPDHAEALVWRGDARLFLAGQAFQRGALKEGQALSAGGLADMDRAVALAPNDIAIRVPRAAGLMPYAGGLRSFDKAQADRLVATAIGDFEFVMAASTPRWNTMKEHGRAELPGTAYAKNAVLRRADPAARVPLTCLGCH